MKELICACTGHRLQNLPFRFNEMDERCISLKERLYVCVENIIKKGVTRFVSGMAIGVDLFFAEIVIELRDEKYPDNYIGSGNSLRNTSNTLDGRFTREVL